MSRDKQEFDDFLLFQVSTAVLQESVLMLDKCRVSTAEAHTQLDEKLT